MISIQNVYYLLLYAWDALEQGDVETHAAEPETKLVDLLATVLNQGIDRLLRQGLHRAYLARQETIPGVRGKLDISATIKADLFNRARTVCEFDELSHDVAHNRILKATVRNLLGTDGLSPRLREPLRSTWHRLHEVLDIPLTKRTFYHIQLHRNNRLYRFLLDICRLLFDCLIPKERTGQFAFRDFQRNEKLMRVLFERFIHNFFRHHAEGYSVKSERLEWEDTTGSAADKRLLPRMRTDVTLRCPGRVIVVDAKFYRKTLQEYRNKETVRSAHLYQLYAYLRNVEITKESAAEVEGILIRAYASNPAPIIPGGLISSRP